MRNAEIQGKGQAGDIVDRTLLLDAVHLGERLMCLAEVLEKAEGCIEDCTVGSKGRRPRAIRKAFWRSASFTSFGIPRLSESVVVLCKLGMASLKCSKVENEENSACRVGGIVMCAHSIGMWREMTPRRGMHEPTETSGKYRQGKEQRIPTTSLGSVSLE